MLSYLGFDNPKSVFKKSKLGNLGYMFEKSGFRRPQSGKIGGWTAVFSVYFIYWQRGGKVGLVRLNLSLLGVIERRH